MSLYSKYKAVYDDLGGAGGGQTADQIRIEAGLGTRVETGKPGTGVKSEAAREKTAIVNQELQAKIPVKSTAPALPGTIAAGTLATTAAPTLNNKLAAAPQVADFKNLSNDRILALTDPLRNYKVNVPGQLNTQLAQDNSQYSPQQAQLLQQLQRNAMGQGGPSPAELILARQNQQNTSQAMALAASQSGRALPVAQRQIMQQAALGGQDAAQQAAILRAQEMLQAQGLAASSLQNARQSDLELGMANSAAQNQMAQFNNQQAMQAEQLRAQVAQEAAQAGIQLTTAQLNAAVSDRAAQLQNSASIYGTNAQFQSNANQAAIDQYKADLAASLGKYQTDQGIAVDQRNTDVRAGVDMRGQDITSKGMDIDKDLRTAQILMSAEQERARQRGEDSDRELSTASAVVSGAGASGLLPKKM